jgi:uncharacterized protein
VAVLGEERAGSDVRETFEAADSLASSPLTFVETHSALAASKLSGRISPNAYAAAREAFARLWPGLDVVDLDGSLAARAAEVVDTHALRFHAAVQLASALALEDPTVVMITLDRRLRRAAKDAGLGVAP